MEKELKQETKKRSFGIAWIFLLIIIALAILTFVFVPILISSILFIAIYLPIIVYILIYKWINRWFAALVFSFSIWLNIVILIIPIAGGLLALDLMHFSKDFANSPKYVALDDNGLIFGMNLDSLNFGEQSTNRVAAQNQILTQSQLDQLQTEINSGVRDKIVFVIKKDVFRNVGSINIQDVGITVSKDEIIDLLKTNDPNGFLINRLQEGRQGLPAGILGQQIQQNPEQIKMLAFLLLVQKTIEKGGSEYLIDEIKNSNIKIYPERKSLKILIKLIPANLLSNFLPEISNIQGAENINGKIGSNEQGFGGRTSSRK